MDVKYVKSVTRRREKQVQISHFYRLTYKILNINHSQKVHRQIVDIQLFILLHRTKCIKSGQLLPGNEEDVIIELKGIKTTVATVTL